jgi:hypothetical protein
VEERQHFLQVDVSTPNHLTVLEAHIDTVQRLRYPGHPQRQQSRSLEPTLSSSQLERYQLARHSDPI